MKYGEYYTPATPKILQAFQKIKEVASEQPLSFCAERDRYTFEFKGHRLFMGQDVFNRMFFGVEGFNPLYVIPERLRAEFYSVLWPEATLDAILAEDKNLIKFPYPF